MLLVWDLGISGLVIVVCLIVPVIGFLVRRQWRLEAARREEIGRLLILASEEAARAEIESSFEYSSVSFPNGYHCPVCFCPATTRCSRCKAVRYCSGKCQIIHWRQGHKDECRPARITFKTDHEKSDSGLRVRQKDEGNTLGEAELQHAKSDAMPIGESVFFSDSTSFAEEVNGDITDIKDESLLDKEEAISVAETTGSSFSGFSSSPSNDSSDDVSLCESFSSSDSERSVAPLDANIAVESVETCFGSNDVAPSELLSPKFTHLVESADNFNKSAKLNQCKAGGDVTGNQSQTSSLHSSVTNRDPGSANLSSMVSSGFWGRTLESVECANDSCDGSALSELGGAGNGSVSDTESLRFTFSSFKGIPADPAKISDVKSKISDKAPKTALEREKISDKVTPSERSFERSTNGTSGVSHVSCAEGAKTSLSTSSCDDPASVVRGVSTCSGPSDTAVSSPVAPGKSKSTIKENDSTFGPLKPGEVPHFTSRASDGNKISDVAEHSPLGAECGREVANLTSRDLDANKASHLAEHSLLGAKSGSVPDNQKHNATAFHAAYSVQGRNGLKASVLKVVDQWTRPKLSNQSTMLAGNEVAKSHGHKALFPYESFAKLYNWNKLELRPFGLINCGNSCYANVVLQCLMFTPPLTAYFLQGLHSRACQNKEQCFTCGFENLVLKAKEGRSLLSPEGLLSQLQNIGIRLCNGKEEDAHEFLRFAVDTMQSTCIKESRYDMLEKAEMEGTTLIGLTFGGYLRSKIKCMKCQGNSERQERMMDLTVEIDGDVSTLDEALRRFTRTEILDGENEYKCGRCKSYQRAKKKLKILEPPNVLTIALKRFQSGKFGKLNKSIRFQETLDLAPYVSRKSGKRHIYRLYGVIVHLDIMNAAFSGHYVCYVKNNQNKWYKADDSMVVTSEVERVLTKGAYMLFYSRCSPRPPRSSVCSKTVSSDKKSNVPLPKTNPKSIISQSRSVSTDPSVGRCTSSPDGQPSSIQSFYSKFHRLQRILEEDSSSDSSSLFDSNSDECSCSTDSTRDSSGMDDFADFIFGDLGWGYGQNSFAETSSSSSSSASSPLCTRHSPLAESDRYSSAEEGVWEGKESDIFSHSVSTKPFGRTLGNCRSNSISSSSRTNSESERIRTGRPSPLKGGNSKSARTFLSRK